MAIRAFLSAFLSTALPEYSLVIVCSSYISKRSYEKPRIGSWAGAGFLVIQPSLINASGRQPAPASPNKEKGQGYEHEYFARAGRAAEIDVVLQGPGLHTMRAIAPQVFADCQRQKVVNARVQPRIP